MAEKVLKVDVPRIPFSRFQKKLGGHVGLLVGIVVISVMVLMALFAPWIAPDDPYRQDLDARLIPPIWHATGTWDHPLGTDPLGRDYLTRVIYGSQIALITAGLVVAIAGTIGSLMGIAAGYFGGKVDMVVSFMISVRLSMPVVLVALAVVAIVGGSLTVIIWVLGLLLWDRFAVVMRSATMQIRSLEYVTSARAAGCSTPRILFSEILPNLTGPLVVVTTLEMAHAILLEAALSFLGLGVQPPLPSWGLMIAEGRGYLFFDPWVVTVPGVALFVLVFGINLLGDGVRDITALENRN
ncbi:MAG: ABC transporter permease [Salinarimonadaceae bacterium]|nr:MAG: ABC transporter permease [Salinarimonadaceae bacterium]